MVESVTLTIKTGKGERAFRLFDTRLGRLVAKEIIAGETYKLPQGLPAPKVIIDIGANVGAASLYFALSAPGARVIAFEPASECHGLFRENLADLPSVTLFPFGLWSEDRVMTLHQSSHDPVTASVGHSTFNRNVGTEVSLRQADKVFRDLGLARIDLLKIDTEGAELPILQSLKPWLATTSVIFVEYHSEKDRRALDGLLAVTHGLWSGRVSGPHRGEFCYVAHKLMQQLGGGMEIRSA